MLIEIEDRRPRYRLKLLGAFRLAAPDGSQLRFSSKKGIALLGLLATAGNGERWRPWIQEKLWGTRGPAQAQGSLRRELHGLRQVGTEVGVPLIETNRRVARLILENVDVDVRRALRRTTRRQEFLEGMSVVGEEGFEEWLQNVRKTLDDPSGSELAGVGARQSS
jgi:DNA-binding SARP family transcriptional activator